MAGGRDDYGFWLSTDTAHYMPGFCTKIGMALTLARTGDPTPLSRRRQSQTAAGDQKSGAERIALPARPMADTESPPENGRPKYDDPTVTPRKISFTSSPSPPMPRSPIRPMNLGPGIASSPQSYPRQGVRAREVRTSIREAREARARPETIIETDNENDAPYPDGGNAADMEAAVASLVYDSHADDIVSGNSNLTNWIDFVSPVPANAVRVGRGKLMFDATIDQIKSVIDRGGVDDKTHATLLAVQAGLPLHPAPSPGSEQL